MNRLRQIVGRLGRGARAVRSPVDAVLAARMMGWALLLPVLAAALPLRSLVSLMARPPRLGTRDLPREQTLVTLSRLAHRAANLGLRDNCLERSLLAYRYLSAANAAPVLVVGASAGDSGIEGHVWLTVDGVPVHDGPDVAHRFTQVTAFGPDGHLVARPDEPAER